MSDSLLPTRHRVPPRELPELMDEHDRRPAELERAVDALERTNRFLGGRRAVLGPLLAALRHRSPSRVRVLDVGAGGGGMSAHLYRRLSARGWRPSLVLTDLHPQTVRLARDRVHQRLGGAAARRVRYVRLTAARLPFGRDAFHYALSSTMLHHLEREEAMRFLGEMDRVVSRRWVVVDLHRSLPAWLAVRLLAATLWRNNRLPRRDGPISVRRAFTPKELRRLVRQAGVRARVERAWPFRLRILGGADRPVEGGGHG